MFWNVIKYIKGCTKHQHIYNRFACYILIVYIWTIYQIIVIKHDNCLVALKVSCIWHRVVANTTLFVIFLMIVLDSVGILFVSSRYVTRLTGEIRFRTIERILCPMILFYLLIHFLILEFGGLQLSQVPMSYYILFLARWCRGALLFGGLVIGGALEGVSFLWKVV